MLDNETKRRIDTARDILVGKVPDPKSQVEQISIALVYKFMDDMDKEAVELGGNPSFFICDYERYAWSKIFDPRIGGHEMLGLYGEAIVKLNQNPNLPQLFRDIFKNAYLPYRDPETLKLFLKTINEFSYDHSERLGDAFEYLLSVLGSQGDAGQFRTPRHIIDFMVQLANPLKHETVLDPACGTAGFLISSYKHILKENCKKAPGDLINTEERKKLLTNFKGYDISPDMVRLSLVNMYLHGFVQPQIMEYDTLTSEERWNEYADVILANPPFMTPKGGIKPHKKFSVQSNRSEVLFVDYIAEHLTPTGRAAVIVPEGIIFQSATAYKSLRKMLHENHLYAVVSLPAGIFNPYSGVKTSILLMDKQLAKKTDSILLVKIENDGFGLGAQRREIDKNDLPDALNVIKEYVFSVRNSKPETFIAEEKPCSALLVKKEKLAENGEYNLIGDRYRTVETKIYQKWPIVTLGEICEIGSGNSAPQAEELFKEGTHPFFRTSDVGKVHLSNNLTESNDSLNDKGIQGLTKFKKGTILFPKSGASTFLNHRVIMGIDGYVSSHLATIFPNAEKALSEYVYRMLINVDARGLTADQNYPSLRITDIINIKIPLPPLEVQREIVAEIEGYQKLIDGCRQVIDSWKPQIDIDPEWPVVKLGEICSFMTGGTPTSTIKEYYENGKIPWLVSGDIHKEQIYDCDGRITEKGVSQSNAKYLPLNSVLIALNGQGKTRGTVAILRIENATCNQSLVSINPKDERLLSDFLYYQLKSMYQIIRNITGDNQRSGLNIPILKDIKIYLPENVLKQQEIVAKIEDERKVVDGCRELIKTYEEKIKRVTDKVWEE